MSTKELAQRLAQIRAVWGVSARQASRVCGLSPTMWSVIESGSKPDPRASTLVSIARATSIALAWLASGEGPLFEGASLDIRARADHDAIRARLTASEGPGPVAASRPRVGRRPLAHTKPIVAPSTTQAA